MRNCNPNGGIQEQNEKRITEQENNLTAKNGQWFNSNTVVNHEFKNEKHRRRQDNINYGIKQ